MNNSFARLIDGTNATLRGQVLPRLDDEYARSQVWGVINLLNTLKVRADWSAGFLLEQIAAQREALDAAAAIARRAAPTAELPPDAGTAIPGAAPAGELLAARDEGNRRIGQWLTWLGDHADELGAGPAEAIEDALHRAMRAEVDIELRHSPRPLFAQMSGAADE
jgi:hypothetical protein